MPKHQPEEGETLAIGPNGLAIWLAAQRSVAEAERDALRAHVLVRHGPASEGRARFER
jgi:hypothetical protein